MTTVGQVLEAWFTIDAMLQNLVSIKQLATFQRAHDSGMKETVYCSIESVTRQKPYDHYYKAGGSKANYNKSKREKQCFLICSF